jgi:hypothetical protein
MDDARPAEREQGAGGPLLTTPELAQRWKMSARSLERWRRQGRGPAYISLPRKVLYPLANVQAYENGRLRLRGTFRGGPA